MGVAPAHCSQSALYLIKAHAAIVYTETSQPCHESIQVSSYMTYIFMYKRYVLCNFFHPRRNRKCYDEFHAYLREWSIVIHTFNLCKVKSMDDNCGEWVECMGVASGCGEQEVGVASGSG